MNGSSANGGCPSPSVGIPSGITTCDSGTHSVLGEEVLTAGVLIDGFIPTIDTAGEWAAPLFTVRGSTDTVTLGFRFPARVVLHEVELYLFHCPAWGIGAERITIHNGASFPQFIGVFNSTGSVDLTTDLQNCTSLTRVSLPLQMARNTSFYFMEFSNSSGDLIEWVHIAEVRFSDLPITKATTATPLAVEIVVIVVVLLLLLVCVLGAKVCTREGRDDEGDRENDAIKKREVIGTGGNEAYGHVGGRREGRIAESHQNEGADSEYATIQEREVIGTERNEAYGQIGEGREGRIAESHQNVGADSEYATIQEREVIGTERNEAYGQIGEGREGRITESHQNEGADSEYDTIQEREVIATERNEACSHFDGEGRGEHVTEEEPTGADVGYEEM